MNKKIIKVTISTENDKKVCMFHLLQQNMRKLKNINTFIATDNQAQRYNSELKEMIRQSNKKNKHNIILKL